VGVFKRWQLNTNCDMAAGTGSTAWGARKVLQQELQAESQNNLGEGPRTRSGSASLEQRRE